MTAEMLVGLVFWLLVLAAIARGVKAMRRERALNRQAARNAEAWLRENHHR